MANIAFSIRDAEHDGCPALLRFFDILELNELATLETREMERPRSTDLQALVEDFEEMLASHRGEDECAETPVAYVASFPKDFVRSSPLYAS